METSSEPKTGEAAWPPGGARRVVALAVACAVAAAAYAGYTLINKPSTAAAALASGHYLAASRMLEVAAEQGDPGAQNALGNLYYLGLGVERNQTLASRWYLKSAFQSNSDAQINLARQYRLGYGLPHDELRAYAWLALARSNQNENAERHMKLLAGGQRLHPHLIQRARELYPKLESLRPKEPQKESD